MRLLHEGGPSAAWRRWWSPHDTPLAGLGRPRIVFLRDGRVSGQTARPPAPSPSSRLWRMPVGRRDARPGDLALGGAASSPRRRAAGARGCSTANGASSCSCSACSPWRITATIFGAGVVTNAQLGNPNWATYGTAAATATLPGSDPHLAADIASVQRRWGPADVIENERIATGTTQSVQLRAEQLHGRFNAPLVSVVSGGLTS